MIKTEAILNKENENMINPDFKSAAEAIDYIKAYENDGSCFINDFVEAFKKCHLDFFLYYRIPGSSYVKMVTDSEECKVDIEDSISTYNMCQQFRVSYQEEPDFDPLTAVFYKLYDGKLCIECNVDSSGYIVSMRIPNKNMINDFCEQFD